MAILFPNSPSVGQTITVGSVTYTWDGTKWYTNISSLSETDPVYLASSWYSTTNNSTNWNTAHSWGNHASAGYLLSSTASTTYQPLDGDLTAIAALSGTTGLLRKTAANTWSLDTTSYLTGNQTISLSGDASGSGSTSITVTLANSGVTAGTYRSVTVDAKGRVTAGTNPTTLSGYGITDAQPLDADLTAIAALSGTSGLLRKTAANTWSLDTTDYANTGQIGLGNFNLSISSGLTNTGIVLVNGSGFNANSTSTYTYSFSVGPALSNLPSVMTGASTGFIKKTAQDTYSLKSSTTLGENLLSLADVAAISFPRFNADNTVSSLDAASFRTAIGAGAGTVTSVGGTGSVSGITLSGTVTGSGNLTLSGTLSVSASNFASQTANTVLAAPNGTAGTPTFRSLVAADIPVLNQNTTGTASNVTGTVAIANGGTGATTASAALTALGAYPATNPSGYISSNQTITVTGDATGSGATSISLTLANSGVTAGTYGSGTQIPSVTVDSKGRVTGASATTIFSGGITKVEVVATMPGSPNANTLYIVTG